ncbi:MAG: histidine kinase N-terminal 7TM domain-containing protein [Halovenus sp.]
MSTASVLQANVIEAGYWAAYGVTALVCFAALTRARDVEEADVRRSLVWLLGLTGGWSALKLGFFVLPETFRRPVYTVGLVLGFATVWAWLSFCSAYTGRTYHRNTTLRRLGAGVFVAVVSVKLTNPIHGLYFTTSVATTPFPHLAIEHGVFHWAVTGLSYALAATGIFMLFELYLESGYNTRPLAVLTGLTALPVTIDTAALFTPRLVDIIYAPIGVAVFAVGVLYVYQRQFLAVEGAGERDDPLIFLDENDRIQDYTAAATDLFPTLADATGDPLDDAFPAIAAVAERDEQILEWDRDGETRYYLTSVTTVSLGETRETVLLFSDVTRAELRRRELLRHNRQLEDFASALAHELRNVLQIIDWRLAVTADRVDEGTVEHESVETASQANERLSGLVDDFTTLARYGQTVERLETVEFRPAVEDAWWNADTDGMDLTVASDGSIEADPGRTRELFRNAFEFARFNDAGTVTVALQDGRFTISDDGNPPGDDIEGYFAYGESVPTAEAGMKLPNVRTFAQVHGWTVGIDTGYDGGVRLVVSGVDTAEP